ncbi:MAG: DNA-3-methyladenine glycosylase 2 [Oscillospiraceae bacterium]|nr:DNA-3-methyladenine glycosylase 2 [Oscillospiraceae bacterium]
MEYFINAPQICLESTFFCGQCFRWQKIDNDSYSGIVGNRHIIAKQAKDGIILQNVDKLNDFSTENELDYWERYFATDIDYDELKKRFSEDETLKSACEYAPGIRVLKQEPFEMLISFIISQNNNIPRITCIIKNMCERFGVGGAFPTADVLSKLTEYDLAPLKMGYRMRFVLDAAKKLENKEIVLDKIEKMQYNDAKKELLKIVGVGDKVADCVLLFGFAKYEAFPLDVWVKRVLKQYYPNSLPDCTKGVEGIAQQFLFHYIRSQ